MRSRPPVEIRRLEIWFGKQLAEWALEERRNHDVYVAFARAVDKQAWTMPFPGLDGRRRLRIAALVTARAWATEVDPPEEDLEPEAEAFMAQMRREIHGF